MSTIASQLDYCLQTLDAETALRVEQLVRDAILFAAAQQKTPPIGQWPAGYFEKTAGALAGERFERPAQGVTESREDW